jgi:hypothetical protein
MLRPGFVGFVQLPAFDCFGIGTGVAGAAQAAGTVAAADITAGATKDAAAKQLQANEEAVQFEREQAQQAALQAETDRKANYGQWAAHERGVGTIGQMLGLGGKEIPDYVPGIAPTFTTPAATDPTAHRQPGVPVPPGGDAQHRPVTPTFAQALGQPYAPANALPFTGGIDPRTGQPANTGVAGPSASRLGVLMAGGTPTGGPVGAPPAMPPGAGPIDPRTGLPLYRTFGSYMGAGG